jgi:glycosyltransferase involved in cell wall biosynthesis
MDRPVLLLPGRLTRWKGQAVCLAALALIKDRVWTAVFVGDDQGRSAYRAELAALIGELGLDGRVKLAGHCSDMPAALALADLVLAPSLEAEAFGRVAAEASAMGKPVIASDLGGQRETVIDGQTGWRTPPGDVAALAAAIGAALDLGAAGRAEMGARGARFVRERYSAKAMQTATLAVYDRVLAAKVHP